MRTQVDFDNIPAELRERQQWVLWRSETRDGKLTKVPYSPSGSKAKANDGSTWGTFKQAVEAYKARPERWDGIGFEFTEADEFCGIDLDSVLDPATGEFLNWPESFIKKCDAPGAVPSPHRIVEAFGSYCEVSPSGTGVKLWVRGKLPSGGNRKNADENGDAKAAGIEFYDKLRYFACTGKRLETSPPTITEANGKLSHLHRLIFGHKDETTAKQDKGRKKKQSATPDNLDDARIIELASRAKNGPAFLKLWQGDIAGHPSESEADLALANHLAFYCGADAARIEALMRQSGLSREKWDKHASYLQDTIGKSLEGRTEFYRESIQSKVAKLPPSPNGVQWICVDMGRTDAMNARRFAERFGADVRYCEPWGKWLVWDGKRWKLDDTRAMDARAKAIGHGLWSELDSLSAQFDAEEDKGLFRAMTSFCTRSNSDHGLRSMLSLARSEPGIAVLPNELDKDPWLLNVENGTLDLRYDGVDWGEALRPHAREDMLTKLAPVQFASNADCPVFCRFLSGIIPDNDLRSFVRRLIGYGLTGQTTEHILPIAHGTGANGKSTLFNVLLDLLGEDYAMKAPADLLLAKRNQSHPTELADLHGKRFVAAVETEDGRRLAESLVKELTGGDKVRARRMREDFWQFSATHKIWLATNHKPMVRGTDRGIWRRLKLIPFNVTIADKDQDKDLPTKLTDELPGILLWALSGCGEWRRHGLGEPQAVQQATGEYRAEMDVLGDFIAECCQVGPHLSAGATELFDAFKAWSESAGEHSITQRRFGMQLAERGYQNERLTSGPNKGRKCWRGLAITGE